MCIKYVSDTKARSRRYEACSWLLVRNGWSKHGTNRNHHAEYVLSKDAVDKDLAMVQAGEMLLRPVTVIL